ncbi:MAG: hypothetical protein EZS28_030016, partial [Streblomastix strix]
MLREVTSQELIREIKKSDQYNIPSEERMEQLEERVKEYQRFTRGYSSNVLHYTNGLVTQMKISKRELEKSIKKLNEMKKNREQRERNTKNNELISKEEKTYFHQANYASKQYIRTVQLILTTEQGNSSQQSEIPRPSLSKVPIQYNEVKNESRVRIDRQNILETTEVQLWELRKRQELRKKIYVVFVNESGSDAGGLSAEWFTEYFKEATNSLNGIFRHHGSNNRLTVFGDDHQQGKCRRSPIQQSQNIDLPQIKSKDGLSDEELQDQLPWWAAGAMIGKVLLLQQITTSCCLDYSLWRQLLGQSPCIEDLGEEEQITAK